MPEATRARAAAHADRALRDRARAARRSRCSRSRCSRAAAPGIALAAGRDQVEAALGLGVPVARLRLGAFTDVGGDRRARRSARASSSSQVADPSAYGPVLSFELFVAVILGGARFALGPVVGLAVIAGFSNLAEEIGSCAGPASGTARGDADRLRDAARARPRRRGAPPVRGRLVATASGLAENGRVPATPATLGAVDEPGAARRRRRLEALRQPRGRSTGSTSRSRPEPSTR